MADNKLLSQMLEHLVNEDQAKAEELFHEYVVAKSREIYEELLAEDFDLEEGENPFASKDEEGSEEDTGEEDTGEEDSSDEEGSEDDVGGDATDDFIDDVDGEEGDEEGSEGGDVEDRVMDLEDALEELKAEFEQLMAGEENEPAMGGDDMGAEPAMGGDDMGGMDAMGGEEPDELAAMMEYVNKVSPPKHGDNGTNTKSVVAGKNDMGGTTANIAKSFSTTSGGTQGGLLKPTTQEENFGNVNVPGGNAGKTAFKKKEPGHGAEKKGAGDTAPDKKSLIGSRK